MVTYSFQFRVASQLVYVLAPLRTNENVIKEVNKLLFVSMEWKSSSGNKGDNCLRMREISPRYFQYFLFSEFGAVTRFSMRGISEHEL